MLRYCRKGGVVKKISILLVFLLAFPGVNVFASTNKPLKNICEGLKEMACAGSNSPACANVADSKEVVSCNDRSSRTSDEVGKGIARFVGGLLRVATFWYPEDDTTTTLAASQGVSATK